MRRKNNEGAGEKELAAPKSNKLLGGKIDDVIREIARLHAKVHSSFEAAFFSAARTSVADAIRIGELLHRVRESHRVGRLKGKWLSWVKKNLPFSHDTALRYMACFDRRDELVNAVNITHVRNLSDAYALLWPPDLPEKTEPEAASNQPNETASSTGEQIRPSSEPMQPLRKRHRSKHSIMGAISPEKLEPQLEAGQIEIDKQLTDIIAQINRQDHAAWREFPGRLIARGQDFIKQGERLNNSAST